MIGDFTRRLRLVPLASSFALGCALGRPPGLLAASLAAAGVLLAGLPPLAPVGFLCAGAVASSAARAFAPPGADGEDARLQGSIRSVPERLEGRVRFTLREDSGRLVRVTSPPTPWPLALGDRVRLDATLRAPEGPRNPGGRDRAGELAARGIAVEARALSPPVRIAAPSPLALLEEGRDRFAELASRKLPAPEAALVRAIGSGDRAGIDAPTNDRFARSGLAHLLSVSGLHLAVVAFGVYRGARLLVCASDRVAARVEPRRAGAAVALPITALYALATGADVPVVRSCVAAGLAFAGILLDREADTLNGVALAALAVLAADPGALLDPSFQLSFASVAGLALGSGPLRRLLPIERRTQGIAGRAVEACLSALCASAAATLATAPIVALHFRRLSTVAVVSNVIGVPLGAALTVTAALAAVTSAGAPAVAGLLLVASRPLASLLLWVNEIFAAPSWSALGVGSPGAWGVVGCYVAAYAAWRCRGALRWAAATAAVATLLLPPVVRHLLAVRRGGLEITFLSVGQGDCTAFLLPDGAAVLVDGGGEPQGSYDPGLRDVVPWLRDTGVREIAAVFLSHPHPDHLFGLPAVTEAFEVGAVYTNGRAGDEAARATLERLPRRRTFPPGSVLERAGVRFEALGPPAGSEAWTDNDASLVLRVVHGEVAVLLAGDVEQEGEAALVEGTPRPRLRAQLVKIPHHGSATSSSPALVDAVRAAHAVATVGRSNRFGFPSPRVVERWERSGATLHRTDEGAVRFLSDGRRLWPASAASEVDPLALARERPHLEGHR